MQASRVVQARTALEGGRGGRSSRRRGGLGQRTVTSAQYTAAWRDKKKWYRLAPFRPVSLFFFAKKSGPRFAPFHFFFSRKKVDPVSPRFVSLFFHEKWTRFAPFHFFPAKKVDPVSPNGPLLAFLG